MTHIKRHINSLFFWGGGTVLFTTIWYEKCLNWRSEGLGKRNHEFPLVETCRMNECQLPWCTGWVPWVPLLGKGGGSWKYINTLALWAGALNPPHGLASRLFAGTCQGFCGLCLLCQVFPCLASRARSSFAWLWAWSDGPMSELEAELRCFRQAWPQPASVWPSLARGGWDSSWGRGSGKRTEKVGSANQHDPVLAVSHFLPHWMW